MSKDIAADGTTIVREATPDNNSRSESYIENSDSTNGDSSNDSESNGSSDTSDSEDHVPLSDKLKRMMKRNQKLQEYHKVKNQEKKKKAMPKIRTKCSTLKMHQLQTIITNDGLKACVKEMGFESLLHVPDLRMPLEFLKKLLEHFDPEECVLYDHAGFLIPVSEENIALAIGVPHIGFEVPESVSKKRIDKIKERLGFTCRKMTLKNIECELKKCTVPDLKFRQLFLLFVLGYFLSPSTVDCISNMHISAVDIAGEACYYNWAEFAQKALTRFGLVYKGIVKSQRRYPRGIGGCLALLMLIYFEYATDSEAVIQPELIPAPLSLLCSWNKAGLALRAKQELQRLQASRCINPANSRSNSKVKKKTKIKTITIEKSVEKKRKNEDVKSKFAKLPKISLSKTSPITKAITDRTNQGIRIQENTPTGKVNIPLLDKRKGKDIYLEENERLKLELKQLKKLMDMQRNNASQKEQSTENVGIESSKSVFPGESSHSVRIVEGNTTKATNSTEQTDPVIDTTTMTGTIVEKEANVETVGTTNLNDMFQLAAMFKSEDESSDTENSDDEEEVVVDLAAISQPSFDIGLTPDPEGEQAIPTCKSSGHFKKNARRRRKLPARIGTDHILEKPQRMYRHFMDSKLWRLVRKNNNGTNNKRRLRVDEIIGSIWKYVSAYSQGEKRLETILEFPYTPIKFQQGELREEMCGQTEISTKMSPVFVLPTTFAKTVIGNYLVSGMTAPFEDVYMHFDFGTVDGVSFMKRAERVFVPVLYPCKEFRHWWAVCYDFLHKEIHVLDGMVDMMEQTRQTCIDAMTELILQACPVVGKRDYKKSEFGEPKMANIVKRRDIHTCGVYLMKWYEDFNGVEEINRFSEETVDDFIKWMVADSILDPSNLHHETAIKHVGYKTTVDPIK